MKLEQKQLLKKLEIKPAIKKKLLTIANSDILSISSLSSAFGCTCEKIILKNKKKFVIKYQNLTNKLSYPCIYYEGKSLKFMHKKFGNVFPKIFYLQKEFFIMNWIEHNNITNQLSESKLAYNLYKIHSIKNSKFGYEFNTPIGGLEQPCSYNNSWINFYRTNRLQMILDTINKNKPMPNQITKQIQKIIDNLEKYIPDSKTSTLIHGDLWSGNILYNNGDLVGLIDPGIYFGNNELDLASLYLLNVVSKDFINKYKDYIEVEKGVDERIGIYKLYYALLNVHLWSREYIHHIKKIIKKYE